MKITYELKQQDFIDSFSAHRNSKPFTKWTRRLLFAVFGVFAAAILLSLIIKPSTDALVSNLPFFAVTSGWIVILWAIPRWSARRQFKGQPAAQGPRTLTLDETGVQWSWNGGAAQFEWKNFVRWVEGETIILLYSSPVVFNMVPKRALSSEELNNLREIIKQNVRIGKKGV